MPLEDVLAVIKGLSGKSRFGAGIVVDSDLVLTCAHVVNLAIGRPIHESSRPWLDVQVAMNFSSSDNLSASIDDAADAWDCAARVFRNRSGSLLVTTCKSHRCRASHFISK